MSGTTIADEMNARARQRMAREEGHSGQDHPRASSIGTCAREMYHQIVNGDQRPAPSFELLQRFQRGREVESLVIQDLMKEGWGVIHTQSRLEIREDLTDARGREHKNVIICTGHIDFKLEWNGKTPVTEVKSLHPNVWGRIECLQDFRNMGSFWERYGKQLPIYLHAYSEPLGLLILDDCLGHRKIIEVRWEDELEAIEGALELCAKAKAAVLGTADLEGECEDLLPPYCSDPATCADCWCRKVGVCFPPVLGSQDATAVLDDPDTVEIMERLEQIEEPGKEYASLHDRFKKKMKAIEKTQGPGDYICGPFGIKTAVSERKGYAVKAGKVVSTTWYRLGEGAVDGR